MPPRKNTLKAATQPGSDLQDGHAGRNGEVTEGRPLRIRKPVDYNKERIVGQGSGDVLLDESNSDSPREEKNPEVRSKKKSSQQNAGAKKKMNDLTFVVEKKKTNRKGKGDKRNVLSVTEEDEQPETKKIKDAGLPSSGSLQSDNPEESANSKKKSSQKNPVAKKAEPAMLDETFAVLEKQTSRKGNARVLETVDDDDEDDNDDNDDDEQPETKKTSNTSDKLNKTDTDYSKIIFSNNKTTVNGEEANLKITSWNVDGLRAWLKKDGAKFLEYENPDILCLQETKCSEDKLPQEAKFKGYFSYWASAEKEGYSGVALFSKVEPVCVKFGIGIEEHDTEGRLITAEYEKFYVITTYVPNAGKNLVTLPKRLSWDAEFKKYLKQLDSDKPVIICGDMNVSHLEIDLANPKTNTKNAGFTKEERDGMTELLSQGFIDTFRHFYPKETGAYTFWTYMRGARSRNIGWRLDYFIVSERLISQVCDNVIRNQVLGSDHCPITLLFHNK